MRRISLRLCCKAYFLECSTLISRKKVVWFHDIILRILTCLFYFIKNHSKTFVQWLHCPISKFYEIIPKVKSADLNVALVIIPLSDLLAVLLYKPIHFDINGSAFNPLTIGTFLYSIVEKKLRDKVFQMQIMCG